MLFVYFTILFTCTKIVSTTETHLSNTKNRYLISTDSLIPEFHVGAFTNSGGEIDTLRPGVLVDCISVGLYSYEERKNIKSIRIKVTEVSCTGNENPILIYDSGNITVEQGPQHSILISYEFLNIEMGPEGKESTCYFIKESALGNTVGKCYKMEYWQENDCDSTYAFSYFQVSDLCPLISKDFTTDQNQLCAGDCTGFSAQDGFLSTFYGWSFPGAIPDTSNEQSPQGICYPEPGIYSVSLIFEDCISRDTIVKTDFIQVLPAPQSNGPADNQFMLSPGESVVLQACASGDSYAWSPPDGLSCNNCPNPLANPASSMEYTLVVGATAGCSDTCHYSLLVGLPPVADFESSSSELCQNDCIDFFFLGSENVDSFSWLFPGAQPPSSQMEKPLNICYPEPGSYPVSLIVDNEFGTDTLTLDNFIHVSPRVQIIAETSQPLELAFGDTVQLTPCALGNSYTWAPPDGLSCNNCPSPTLIASASAIYSVSVSNNGACTTTCEFPVKVAFNDNIYIPNAFSPNGDGVNDFFTAYGKFIQIKKLKIFNRWGDMVWNASGNVPWNGTFKGMPAQQGIYLYCITYSDTRTAEVKSKKGEVLLIR